jgi:hypothetical protein
MNRSLGEKEIKTLEDLKGSGYSEDEIETYFRS